MNILLYVCTLVVSVVLDMSWFFSMASNYKKWFVGLPIGSFTFGPAAVFYLLYACALLFFIVNPAIKNNSTLLYVFLSGLLLGLVTYGAYDLTNQASIREWPMIVTVVDMAWGTIMGGLTSVIVYALYKWWVK